MCNHQHEQQHAKEVGLDTEPYHIKIYVEGIDIDVDVIARDPCDCVEVSGLVVNALRKLDYEPKVLIQP